MATAAARPSSPSSPPPSPPRETSVLHDTSFTLARLTPLWNFNAARLRQYSRDFRNVVAGDVLRGVTIPIQPTQRATAAPIRSCEWTVQNDVLPNEPFDSLVIKVKWEDASAFTAILLPNFTTSSGSHVLGKRKRNAKSDPDVQFTNFPLLLTRGPQPITEQLTEYLATRFDSKASEVNLPPELLAESLQEYLEHVIQETTSRRKIHQRLKILELGFTVPEPKETKVKGALRKITFTLATDTVEELYHRSPTFLESLMRHVAASTAISLSALSLTRIACAGMIIDVSGKMKISSNAGIKGTKLIVAKVVTLAATDLVPI